ncbi:MAG: hypothetical protein IRZ28_10730 [Steroidobacteraceae bacterium]|nr:hypothetical protein [Steroidobacteraceae bacterium]
MRRAGFGLRAWALSVCLSASWGALAAGASGACEREASRVPSDTARHFLVLAASRDVFFDRSGPSFVMLMKADTAAGEVEMGAVGIHADEQGRAVFGTVPWTAYDAFLHEPGKDSRNVMLRLEISEPQYERVLSVLRTWERRAREDQLLYPDDLHMNNILLVKQATEELNRCRNTFNLYTLDWGLEDRISEENATAHVTRLVFEELKRRNPGRHVPDSAMPEGLLSLAGSEPLAAREPAPVEVNATQDAAPAPAHVHHAHAHGGGTQ